MIYPRIHLVIGALCLVLLAGYVGAALVVSPDTGPLVSAVMIAVVLAAAAGLWGAWRARVDTWPEGIAWQSAWRGADRLRWDEVEAVVFSRSWKQVQLIGRGRTCAVPVAMTGQGAFARAVLANVPEARIEDRAFALLSVAAARD